MGLALDELTQSDDQVLEDNGISIMLDNNVKKYLGSGKAITVDFRETPYGKGFIIDGGSSC